MAVALGPFLLTETTTTHQITFTGPWPDQQVNVDLSRIGTQVTMMVPEKMEDGDSNSAAITTSGAGIPSIYRPTLGIRVSTLVVDATNTVAGTMAVNTDGTITFTIGEATAFPNTTLSVGFLTTTLSWLA